MGNELMERLDKYLSKALNVSRKDIKEYIKKGRIFIDGIKDIRPETKIDIENTNVYFDDSLVSTVSGFRYYILNKPAGVITATKDKESKTVLDLLPKDLRHDLSPVGRLDKDTTGLLIITDDGAMLHRLLSPKYHVKKQYLAGTDIPFDTADIAAFKAGLDIGDDKPCKSAELVILEESAETENASLITITEGRFHQVKRMAKSCGKEVVFLKRLSMGNLTLPADLKEGDFRELTKAEVDELNKGDNV